MDEEIISIITNQMIAPALIAVADAPAFAHGEIAENPIPVPSASNINDNAAATDAPAITAAHETPDALESSTTDCSIRTFPPRQDFVEVLRWPHIEE